MKAITTILLAILATTASAQTEITSTPLEVDSIGIENAIITYSNISGDLFPSPTFSAQRLPLSFYPYTYYYKPYKSATLQIPSLLFMPGQSNLYSWGNGSIMATGAEMDMPGLMHIDNGTIGISQSYENTSIYLGAEANKYGFYHGIHTQYGITGNLSYYFSPHISFTAYGTYYFGVPPTLNGGLPMSPGMLGYYRCSTFGGYINYRINERSGILVGGQAVQQIGTNRYQFEPVVTPYFKVGKVVIGLPVGQILNGIIREQTERRRNNKRYQIPPVKR